MIDRNLFSDPFDQPLDYWVMIKTSTSLSEYEKERMLNAVKLDYDEPPSEVLA